ncbi:GIN domain-containing protein [Dyadobacter sp. Leaf189]|uniref:GIN domain-containing protein n=1 Tax=Dyadobacter sp. Leaf189 TaxID=1736295 RepID=UPI0006FC14CC|nr:DUF2807 domain-containing protein [Dyadobacter sp. Leaf189]KQS33773.1 hypothetical protein ASG33_06895 [Dyadobacter sp. Leaf189]
MKQSNIFLIALFSLTFLVLLGSNLILKAEFNQIDLNDPFYGFRKETVKPFQYVKLGGKTFGLTEINQGDKFEVMASPEKKYYEWKIIGDTLVFNYKREWEQYGPFTEQTFNIAPNFYITAPGIKTITADNVPLRVKNWKKGDLAISMKNGVLLLTDNAIENLDTDVRSGGLIRFGGRNSIGNVNIQLRDSSSLKVEKDTFKSFKADIDTLAHIEIPGKLYEKLR